MLDLKFFTRGKMPFRLCLIIPFCFFSIFFFFIHFICVYIRKNKKINKLYIKQIITLVFFCYRAFVATTQNHAIYPCLEPCFSIRSLPAFLNPFQLDPSTIFQI